MINPVRRFLTGRRIAGLVTVSMVSVVVFAVAVITILDVARQRTIFETQFEQKGLALARTLNDVLANSLYFQDREKLRHLTEAATGQPEILSLTVFTPEGRVLVAPGTDKFPYGQVPGDIVSELKRSPDAIVRFLPDHTDVLSPVIVSGEMIGGIQIRYDNSSLTRQINDTIVEHILQGALVALFVAAISLALARHIVRPVREMVGFTERVATDESEVTFEQHRSDEIGDLARALEQMSKRLKQAERERAAAQNARLREANERLRKEAIERERAQLASETSRADLATALKDLQQAQDTLVQQERLRAVGQMTSGIAHDINNRLQVILSITEELISAPIKQSDIADDSLKMIRDSVSDASDVIHLLADFYRPKKLRENLGLLNMEEVIHGAVQLTEPRWKNQAQSQGVDFNVTVDIDPLPKLLGSAAALREALINMLFNAIDALPEGGRVQVRGFVDNDAVIVEVSDNGAGMSEDVRRKCLEPFFTTKGEKGSGLGMSMIYRTVQRHDGQLEIDSEVGAGTTVRLRLPVRAEVESDLPVATPSAETASLDILIADDEQMVRELIAALLKHDGHRIVVAVDGAHALEQFAAGKFDLAIVDRAMPGMNGDELALALKDIEPELPVIMLTGFGGLMSATGEMPPGIDMMLGKPIRRDDLCGAVTHLYRTRRRERHPA